jgi:hypothetical protein
VSAGDERTDYDQARGREGKPTGPVAVMRAVQGETFAPAAGTRTKLRGSFASPA